MDVVIYDISKKTGRIDRMLEYKQVGDIMIPLYDKYTGEDYTNAGLLTLCFLDSEITTKQFLSLLKDKHIRRCTLKEIGSSLAAVAIGLGAFFSLYMLLYLLAC